MARIALLACLALSVFAHPDMFRTYDGLTDGLFTNATLFLNGVWEGSQKDSSNPDACAADFKTVNGLALDALTALEGAFNGDITQLKPMIKDVDDLYTIITTKINSTECDWTSLNAQIAEITGPNGKSILTQRYLSHFFSMTGYIGTIKSCANDWGKCGKAVGGVIQDMLEWSL